MSKMKKLVLGVAAAGVLLAALSIPAVATRLGTLVATVLTATTATITTLTVSTTLTMPNSTVTNAKIASGAVDSAKLASTFFDIKTKAQFDAATPTVGQAALCSNCTAAYSLCIGTAATLSSWARVQTGTVDTTKIGCGTNQ